MPERPTAAIVLSLIAGTFLLLAAIRLRPSPQLSLPSAILGAFLLITAVFTLFGSAMLYLKPELQMFWGVLILVPSILSFLGAVVLSFGFFLVLWLAEPIAWGFGFVVLGYATNLMVGFIAGVVGGILALVWKRPVAVALAPQRP